MLVASGEMELNDAFERDLIQKLHRIVTMIDRIGMQVRHVEQ